MASIDWNRILGKAEKLMESPSIRKKRDEIVKGILLGKITIGFGNGGGSLKTVEEAADKFIQVLHFEINSHIGEDFANGGISELAAEVMEDVQFGKPYSIGDKCYIDVFFMEELSRESLRPEEYDGIDNVVALLNSGYVANDYVYGVWTNHRGHRSTDMEGNPKKIASLKSRGGAHFMEQAIIDFMGNYATEYNVTKIELSDEYGVRTD
jgi:hypothetical protein